MIAFDSPEATRLRAMPLSRSALAALWAAALDEGRDSWVDWAGEELSRHATEAETAALRFVQAARDGDIRRARQLWAILATFPIGDTQNRIIRVARALNASLPI